MELNLLNEQGQPSAKVDAPDTIFGRDFNEPLVHQVVVAYQANARSGNRQQKDRSEVRHSTKKPWRQKGTGRARQGTIRAPHWRGGGVVFGPTPRSYEQKMPRKMRRQALRSALSVKASGEQLRVLDALQMDAPRTKEVISILSNLGMDSSVLILLPHSDEVILRSVRNLPKVRTLVAQYLNVRDLLKYDYILMPLASLEVIEGILG